MMLLSNNAKMKKRKEKKQEKKKVVSAKMFNSAEPVPVPSRTSPVSDTSIGSEYDPSDYEVIAKKNFPVEAKPLAKRQKVKKKKKDKKVKVQAQALQRVENTNLSLDGKNLPTAGQSKSPMSLEWPQKVNLEKQKPKKKKNVIPNVKINPDAKVSATENSKFGEIKMSTSSDASQRVNLETQKRKKKKKKHGHPDSITSSNTAQKRAGDRENSKIASEESCGDSVNLKKSVSEGNRDSSRMAIGVAAQGKRLQRHGIDDIFEEAEMCWEEAIRKKMDEAGKLLTKGTKSVVERKEKRAGKRKPDYEDLSFKKSRVEVDTSLLETTGEGISSGLTGAQKILDKVDKLVFSQDAKVTGQETKLPDIDPNKFIPVKTQKLRTALPEFEEGGDSESDEDEEQQQQRMNMMEAFADDDIADQFRKEKEEAEEESKPKTVDLKLPGWGSWGGVGIEPKKNKWNKKVLQFPGVARKDQGKKLVIINDDPPFSFRKQQVDDLPSEFPSVAAYEASIRAPIGTTWVPQLAHDALVAAPVVSKMGAIIRPLDESHLIKQNAEEEAQKKMNASIKTGKPAGRFKHKAGKPKAVWDHERSSKLSKSIRKEKITLKQKRKTEN